MFLCSDGDYFCLCGIFLFNGNVAGSCSWGGRLILCILHYQRDKSYLVLVYAKLPWALRWALKCCLSGFNPVLYSGFCTQDQA